MSEPVDTSARSAGVRPIPALVDVQAHTLAVVLAANVRYALAEAVGAEKWLGAAVVDYYDFPVTLNLLSDYRLPSLSCWRVRTGVAGSGQRRGHRRATFAVRYWLDATPGEWLPKVWPALQAANEVIAQTLTGRALIDLDIPGERRVPSTDLLELAGFDYVFPDTIVGEPDFAIDVSGETGQLYPVLNVTFDASHVPMFGGLPYPTELDLPLLEQLCFQLWDGTPEAVGGRTPDEQPIVEGQAQSLEARSRALLGES